MVVSLIAAKIEGLHQGLLKAFLRAKHMKVIVCQLARCKVGS